MTPAPFRADTETGAGPRDADDVPVRSAPLTIPTSARPMTGPGDSLPLPALRALLAAHQAIVTGQPLSTRLAALTDTAARVLGTEYCALECATERGRFAQVAFTGMGPPLDGPLGDLPEVGPTTGDVLASAQPRHSDDLAARGARTAIASPPRGRPSGDGSEPTGGLRGFLAVPVIIRDEVVGVLMAGDSHPRAWTDEDDAVLAAFAGVAAIGLDALWAETQDVRNQSWLAASARVTRELLADVGRAPPSDILNTVKDLAGADYVGLRLGAPDETEARAAGVHVADPFPLEFPRRITVPHRYARFEDVVTDGSTNHLGIGPLLVAPLTNTERSAGVLYAGRRIGRPLFTAADLEMASGFAVQIALALELAEAKSASARTRLLEDRSRIARELHDTVMQRLCAIGDGLVGVGSALVDDTQRQRVAGYVDDLTETINTIRTTIFQLQPDEFE